MSKPENTTKRRISMNNIDHPSHYNVEGKKECIDEIKEIFGPEAQYYFCVGNCWKYLYRAGLKDDKMQDIKKAAWYYKYILENELYRVITPNKFINDIFNLSNRFFEVWGLTND